MLDPRTFLCLIPALLLTLAGCSLAPVTAKPQRTTHLRPRPHKPESTVPTPADSSAPVALPSPSQPVVSSSLPPPAGAAVPPADTAAAPMGAAAAAVSPGAVPPATVPPDVPPTNPGPLQLVGLSQSEVRRLLGPPTASSTKGAAVAWIYQHAGCTIEIAFYYDVTRNGFFALSQRSTGGGEAQACLANAHDNHAS
jgi:hypothetical protein